MSTKTSLFLTKDNEHCYLDCSEPCTNKEGEYIGNTIFIEMLKKNIDIMCNDDEQLVIAVKAGSELYDNILKMQY